MVTQHSTFDYLLRWLGIEVIADLEPKPGLPPGSAHLRNVLATPDLARASVIMVASYQDDRPARWLSSQSGVPAIVLPGTVTGQPGEETLEQVINLIVDTLLNHQEPTNVE